MANAGTVVVISVNNLKEALASGARQEDVETTLSKQKGEWPLIIITGSKPGAAVLVYTLSEWEAFLDGVKNREFDDLAAAALLHRRLKLAAYSAAVALVLTAAWFAWRQIRRPARR